MTEKPSTIVFDKSDYTGLYRPTDDTLVFRSGQMDPVFTLHPDGTVEIRGDTYEAAKLFWDYVIQFAEQARARQGN